jgi:hypothetical protein
MALTHDASDASDAPKQEDRAQRTRLHGIEITDLGYKTGAQECPRHGKTVAI